MAAVIAVVLCGFGLLVVIAVIVGMVDAAGAPGRRLLAAERRRSWEARHLVADPSPRDDRDAPGAGRWNRDQRTCRSPRA